MPPTTAKQKSDLLEREDELTKDELNLAEYPLMLMARRVPKGLKTLEYHGWVTIEGKRKPLNWIVTGSDKFGLPTGADQDVLVAIMEVWRENGFKDRNIPVGSIYHMLKKLGVPPDGRAYRRFTTSLDRWTGLYIVAENAFWDRKNKCYVARKGFHIFETYNLLDRYSNRGRNIPLPLGFIQASEFFYESVRNGNLKDLSLTLYRSLPTPLAKRLYRYLDKKRHFGASFSIGTYRLALKLGLAQTALDKYTPGKIRQLLVPALEALKAHQFLTRYLFSVGKAGPKVTAFFAEPGSAGREEIELEQEPSGVENSGDFQPRGFQDDEFEEARRDLLIQDIIDVTGIIDGKRSRAFYHLVAQRLDEQTIRRALSETKAASHAGEIRTTSGKFFTDTIKRLAAERGIVLNPKKKNQERSSSRQ